MKKIIKFFIPKSLLERFRKKLAHFVGVPALHREIDLMKYEIARMKGALRLKEFDQVAQAVRVESEKE